MKKNYPYSYHPKTNISNMWVYFLSPFLDMVSGFVYITDINLKKKDDHRSLEGRPEMESRIFFFFLTVLSSNIANHLVCLGLSQSYILRNPLVTGKPRTVGHLTST